MRAVPFLFRDLASDVPLPSKIIVVLRLSHCVDLQKEVPGTKHATSFSNGQ